MNLPALFNKSQPVAPALQGYAPAYQQLSDFAFDEALGLSGGTALNTIGDTRISIYTPANLINRKVYAWIFSTNTNASDNYVIATIRFSSNNSLVGRMPLCIGNQSNASGNTKLNKSIPSLFLSSQTSFPQDSLNLMITNPPSGQPNNVILVPLYLRGVFDAVTCSIDAIHNVSDTRIWIGVFSSH